MNTVFKMRSKQRGETVSVDQFYKLGKFRLLSGLAIMGM